VTIAVGTYFRMERTQISARGGAVSHNCSDASWEGGGYRARIRISRSHTKNEQKVYYNKK
jgi:hypothetical protein